MPTASVRYADGVVAIAVVMRGRASAAFVVDDDIVTIVAACC